MQPTLRDKKLEKVVMKELAMLILEEQKREQFDIHILHCFDRQ